MRELTNKEIKNRKCSVFDIFCESEINLKIRRDLICDSIEIFLTHEISEIREGLKDDTKTSKEVKSNG